MSNCSVFVFKVLYGVNHFKSAWFQSTIAQVYLEGKQLPRQAKIHCEKAMLIQVEHSKAISSVVAANENAVEVEPMGYEDYVDDLKYQMILNFVYGRSCTLLKE